MCFLKLQCVELSQPTYKIATIVTYNISELKRNYKKKVAMIRFHISSNYVATIKLQLQECQFQDIKLQLNFYFLYSEAKMGFGGEEMTKIFVKLNHLLFIISHICRLTWH